MAKTQEHWCRSARTNQVQIAQRLACLEISGAIPSASTAGMRILLDLPPLYLMVKSMALIGMYKLKMNSFFHLQRIGSNIGMSESGSRTSGSLDLQMKKRCVQY